ncbi:HAMP domain-containing histidine kinase [Paenibacillus tritici]|uniref:HAMP domain-containing sensor histidine kinase n=1 Tax=Paenibacillus tritici TaxID=1873425 RepID=UPI001BABBDAD|nr:HAMP domain-containing sensor histidine kinase [Paenibacillus tritici]QUL54865.1 HAMP domain-containing histidine kinase [Paenibacillus tritici]
MEAVKPIKTVRLRTFFLHYLLLLSLGTILLLGGLLGVFTLAFAWGAVLPANYAEKEIAVFKEQLAASGADADGRAPDWLDYTVFTVDGKPIAGNLNRKDAAQAWRITRQGDARDSYFYTTARHGQQLWIFRYTLTPQYASSLLRSSLPNPQLLGILLFVVGILLQAALLAARFGRRLSERMAGLQEATENIQRENLEFTVKPSGIHEIDEVLASLDRMKDALHASLERQWELERSRREQISALAHDIKTPLTIIRGNAELLQETSQNEAQHEYNSYILRSAADIEAFVQEVIDLSSLQAGSSPQASLVPTADLVAELELQIKALSSGKGLQPSLQQEHLPESLIIQKELLLRGIVNLIANAAEHTPPQGSVALLIRGDAAASTVEFIVTDTGPGFSQTDLREAANQFYRGDQSRGASHHHGMGLYIARSVAEQHGGSLSLDNVSPSGGAKVTLRISVPAPRRDRGLE